MAQPKPFALTFRNVSYEVPVRSKSRIPCLPGTKEKKKILHDVSGHVAPGEFLGILGPSGAGKSTLLNLLAARSAHALSSGTILFSGRPRIPRTKRYIGYVTQDDIFFNKLTVRETLEFTANIRLPSSLRREEKLQYVNDIIDKVGLSKCQHTRIGDAFEKGISGGERKRLNIANELIHEPSLFLADEPTSGLDSSSALTILNVLDDMKRNGKTIVISIHQPSSKMFAMFSNILVLASGKVAYFGKPDNVINYFESLDFPFPGTAYNPADYLLELVIDTNSIEENDGKVRLSSQQRILNAWEEHKQQKNKNIDSNTSSAGEEDNTKHSEHVKIPVMDSSLENTSLEEDDINGYVGKPPTNQLERMMRAVTKRLSTKNNQVGDQKYTTNWSTQISALVKRSARQKQGVLIQGTSIAQVIITTALLLMFWFRIDPREGTIEDRLGFMSFVGVNWAFFTVSAAIFSFPTERSVLTKDRASGVYRLSAYYMAKTIVEIPADTLYPLASCLALYYAVGMNPDVRCFILFCTISVLNALIGQSIGLFVSALLMDVRQALVLGSSWVLASLMVSGFVIDPNNIPGPIKFVRQISFLRYAYEAIIRTEFLYGRTYICETDVNLQTIYSQNGERCPVDESALLDAAQIKDPLPIWGYIAIQFTWIVALRLLGYFALKLLHNVHKPKLSTWKSS